ncbi:proteasome activator complex subunit 4-like isoform X2 [Branchiostoma floridae x Branchiostoma japonicum]
MANREQKLGFLPQKEIVYNKLLPYADCLDSESNEFLSEIKSNLGRAVALRELKPGAVHWTARLGTYIRLYGRKFSKEDHVMFVKLYYELMTIPDLELPLVQKFAQMLTTLLKKRELLSRDDLVLPWRPLYELVERLFYSSWEPYGLEWYPSGRKAAKLVGVSRASGARNPRAMQLRAVLAALSAAGFGRSIENVIKNVVRMCRVYFSVESSAEMLEEWRPLLCPFDVTTCKAMSYFEMFLPTTLPPEHHDKGFKLWLDELLKMWDNCHNCPSWEQNLVNLFARVALDNIGYIDWSPWVSKLFTRLLRSLNLPVGSKQLQVGRAGGGYDVAVAGIWIVSMMGGPNGDIVLDHIQRFFQAVETYFHPSNNGRWMGKLQKLIYKLPSSVVKRLHRERYRKPSWDRLVPDAYKLTDTELEKVVEHMKPPVMLAIFSKTGSQDAAQALQNLALIRPDLILPPVLEKTYLAMETLTEPHQLIATMCCVVTMAREMVKGGRYPEGPSNLLPLLFMVLPGIDPNDFAKCMITFQFISTFCTLVPLVDCSEALQTRSDLTEREKELCSSTAGFEDFVMQFMDKCFALIENSTLEQTTTLDTLMDKMSNQEGMVEIGLTSTFSTILTQSSPAIYQEAIKKLFHFASSHMFETKVAGRMAANMCRAASKAHPEFTLKLFLPHCAQVIMKLTEAEDVQKEEQLDDELLWNLQMLADIVRCDGLTLVAYRDQLVPVLKRSLHLTCKDGYTQAGLLLRHALRALTLIYPQEYRSMPCRFDRPLDEYLPIRDWGTPGNLFELGLRWHIPSLEEKKLALYLLDTFLQPELDGLEQHSEGTSALSRDELQRTLMIVHDGLIGAGAIMPMWEEPETADFIKSKTPLRGFVNTYQVKDEAFEALLKQRKNLRAVICKVMQKLVGHILTNSEDDTKSLSFIIKIYSAVLFYYGTLKHEFDGRWKSFTVVKKAIEDKLQGKKRHIRALLVDRVSLQHEMRVLDKEHAPYTPLVQEVMQDLLKLSTSHYGEVRAKAQQAFLGCLQMYPYCHLDLLPSILTYLKDDPNISHDQFKGALYVLLGTRSCCLASASEYPVIRQLWPTILQAGHSEKPSIQRLIEDVTDRIHRNYETVAVQSEVSEASVDLAKAVLASKKPAPSCTPTTQEVEGAAKDLERRNKETLDIYHDLVNTLLDLLESGKLRWRFVQISIGMLTLQIRRDTPLPPRAVAMFTRSLVDDTITVRKMAIGAVVAILKQQKREHKKKEIEPFKEGGCQPPPPGSLVPLGERDDNKWLQYDSSKLPKTQDQWDSTTFVDKTHWGFNTWPKPMLTYAPADQQPPLGRKREDMSEGEGIIFDHFSNTEFVDKLIGFLSLEDRKGRDKFSNRRFNMFKGLFRNYDDTLLPLFKPHMERLAADTQEFSQRCLAEIVAGLIRGAKHWTFDKQEKLYEFLLPLLKTVMTNASVETIGDWAQSMSSAVENRDPRKIHWLLEALMEDCANQSGGSFLYSSRLYVLQSALNQQEWRVPELLHRLLTHLEPHLPHVYKNVRDRLGSVLTNIFMYELPAEIATATCSPQRGKFLQGLLPKLAILETLDLERNGNGNGSQGNGNQGNGNQGNGKGEEPMEVQDQAQDGSLGETDEKKEAIQLIKTVMKWMISGLARMYHGVFPELYQLLPLIMPLESTEKDDELQKDAQVCLACVAQAYLSPDIIPTAMEAVKQVAFGGLWRARLSIMTFLQVLVFCNLFLVQANKSVVADIRKLLLKLLQDEQLEVREMAGTTLSGFLQCGLIALDKDLQVHFNKLCHTKLPKKKKLTDAGMQEALIQRHAGVLGLCACVLSYPYDVPEWMPQLLLELGDHLNDPQPIAGTVKKTLSDFRRTHHDNWQEHKQRFTEDQLCMLTDLLVSPSYYA